MSFVISTLTVASAVTNGGTLTFGYPTVPLSGNAVYPYPFDASHQNLVPPAPQQGLYQTSKGDFFTSGNHYTYSSGNQAKLIYGVDFTLTFNTPISSGITWTYQGSGTIPVGSVMSLQLEFVGQNDGRVFNDGSIIGRGCLAPIALVRLGAPLALSGTTVLATTAVGVTTLVTLSPAVVLDVARGISAVSSNAGDTTQTITIRGFDEYGNAMTEAIALNGTTTVDGKKAWKTVASYQASATLAGNLSIGQTNVLGLPLVLEAAGYVIAELLDGAANANAGTKVAGVIGSVVSATTGDVRGTYTPSTTLPNGSHVYEVGIITPDPRMVYGLTQYAG